MLKAVVIAVHTIRARIQAWKAKRQKRLAANRFDSGYSSAMATLTTREMTPEFLYRTTETAEVLGRYTDYHAGTRAAIYDFELSGADEDPVHTGPLNTSTLR